MSGILRLAALTLFFLSAPPLDALVLSEIMYHPAEESAPGIPDKRYEWIELQNESGDPLDLSGYSFVKGIEFTFPQGTFLAGRAFAVVGASREALLAKYDLDPGLVFEWSHGRSLDDSGETVAVANPSGLVVTKVTYNDRGRWPAGADGTGHTLALRSPFREVDDPDSWALSQTLGGSPGLPNFGNQAVIRDRVLIEEGEMWSYLPGDGAPPASWPQPSFDDSGWPAGPTAIGFGSEGIATSLDDMPGHYLTVYCRKKFAGPDLAAADSLVLAITYDDGFYAYLNGRPVASRNVTRAAWDAGAASDIDSVREEIDLSAYRDLLVPGAENVLAVEVHDFELSSGDLRFNARLLARRVLVPPDAPTVPVVLNEALIRTSGDRWIELHNLSDTDLDLDGFHLTDDRLDLGKSTLPPTTILPARGFLAFTDRELGLNFSLTSPAPRARVFVALVNPGGTRVVDAWSFKPAVDEKSEARVPDGDREMAPAAVPTRGAANRVALAGRGGVVINEVMYHPISEDPADEYIELYNRGPDTVDMGGFRLTKAVEFEFPSISLAPGQYLVVAGDPARIAAAYGLPQEGVVGPWRRTGDDGEEDPDRPPASLSRRGERITLLDPSGNVASTVRYADGGEWPSWADGGGSSLELIDPSQPIDCAQSWDASDDSAKSVPARFTYTGRHAGGDAAEDFTEVQALLLAPGIAVIDDFTVERGGTQYVVNGTFESDAGGWEMVGTHVRSGRTTDPRRVLSGSGSLELIATGSGDNKGNHVRTALSAKLEPYTPESPVEYTVSLTARWIVGSRSLLTRGYNHGLARVHSLPIPARLGTPLARNSVTARRILEVGEPNLGPVIDRVAFSPVVPGDGEPVTVTARIRDSDGIRLGSAVVWFALETPPASASGWTPVAMAGPDPDGLHRAILPVQDLGKRVLFFIAAEDGSPAHHPGRYPLDAARRTHPPILDPANPAPGDARFVIYRHEAPAPAGPYPTYRFVLDEASVDYLWSRPAESNDLVTGTLVFESEKAYPGVGIRWSGSPFNRQPKWENSYRVHFPGDDLLHQRTKSLDLENHGADARERISNYLLRYANVPGVRVPYSLQSYVRWQVNGEFNGLFEQVARPDKDFLGFWFPGDDEGEMFKLDDRFEFRRGGGFFYTGARITDPPYPNQVAPVPDPQDGYIQWRENFRWFFNPQVREDREEWTGLIGLARLMDPLETSDAAFDQAIASSVDVEEMLRVLAIRLNTDDWDTWGAARGKNAYFYRRPSDGRWVLIPWDLELTYQSVQSFPLGSTPAKPIPASSVFPEVARMLNRPAIKRRYYGILAEMVNRQFGSRFLSPWMDVLRANGGTYTEKGSPGNFIDQRADLIRAWIRPVVYPQERLKVTSNGGSPFTTGEEAVDIAGTAPVEVARIVVTRNGVLLDPQPEVRFSTTDMLSFQAAGIRLEGGANRIGLDGYRLDSDDPVDRTSIDITRSQGPGPSLASVSPPRAGPGDAVLLTGTGFHAGLAVYFGILESPLVLYDEESDPTHVTAIVPGGLGEGPVPVTVRGADSRPSNPLDLEVRMQFIRGDSNLDGTVDLSDVFTILSVLYLGGRAGCLEALDSNHDLALDVSDVVGLLAWLFLDGGPPPAPFPDRGISPFKETIGCARGL